MIRCCKLEQVHEAAALFSGCINLFLKIIMAQTKTSAAVSCPRTSLQHLKYDQLIC